MELRTMVILGLCASMAIAAPADEGQGNGDSSDESKGDNVPAEKESDRSKLVQITRALDKFKDELNEQEQNFLDDLLDDEQCEADEDLDEHERQKRGCSSCSISSCRRGKCSVTCCSGDPRCYCSWWGSRAKCKCR